MPQYEYRCQTAAGDEVHGTLTATDESTARRALESQGITVLDLLPCRAVEGAGTLGDEELATLVHAVGSAAATRVPLDLTLSILADDTDDPRLASVARLIAQRLGQGNPVDQAVDELHHELPEEIRGLVRAGIASGNLAGAFEQFTQQRLISQRIGRRLRVAIAYPIVILSIMVPIALLLCFYVVPMFAEMYQEFDLELPPMTEAILQTADQLPGVIAGLLLVVVAVPVVLRLLGGRWLFHRFRAAIPLLGRLWTWSSQREFAALLASFLDQRLPLPRAVECTGHLMSDRNVARSCQRVSERLEAGEPLGASLGQSINFDRTLTAMAEWGEAYGLLPDALRIAAGVFEDRIEQQLAFVRRLMPPAALIAVGAMAIFFVIGLFIPLVDLIQGLSM
jgi:type II secretory pathway component PulF